MNKYLAIDIIVGASLIALGVVAAIGVLSRSESKEVSNHHTIMQVPTDHKDVVCFFRLDNDKRPQDMSCVYVGDDNAQRQTRSGHEAAARVHSAERFTAQW